MKRPASNSGGANSYPRGTVSGATARGFSRRKGQRVAEKAGHELAGVAPETVPRGTLLLCHERLMADDMKYALAVLQGIDCLLHVRAMMFPRTAVGALRHPRGTVSGATAGGFSRSKG